MWVRCAKLSGTRARQGEAATSDMRRRRLKDAAAAQGMLSCGFFALSDADSLTAEVGALDLVILASSRARSRQ
jgi:hypothetical protein